MIDPDEERLVDEMRDAIKEADACAMFDDNYEPGARYW